MVLSVIICYCHMCCCCYITYYYHITCYCHIMHVCYVLYIVVKQWVFSQNTTTPLTLVLMSPLLPASSEQFCLQFSYKFNDLSPTNTAELIVELIGDDQSVHHIHIAWEPKTYWVSQSIPVTPLSTNYQVTNAIHFFTFSLHVGSQVCSAMYAQ